MSEASPLENVRLIATDLDGTLIGSANEFPLYNDFREVITELRRRNNVIWAACTGRSRASFDEFFSPMQSMGIVPDYVIYNHAYVARLTRLGFFPHITWNLAIRHTIWSSQVHAEDAIREWHQLITGGAHGVRTVRLRRSRLHLRFNTEEAAQVAANMLRERVKSFPHLRVFEYLREVDVRTVPFTKGLAVSELARHLGIDRGSILAIGNGHNDISMLDGHVAAYTGCPANSDEEVMEVVHNTGGHIAHGPSLTGVMEILRAYRDGTIESDLPPDWKPTSQKNSPWPDDGRDRDRYRRRRSWRKAWWGLGIIYAVLVVFASFNIIPFSSAIMKPFNWLVSLVTRFMRLLWE